MDVADRKRKALRTRLGKIHADFDVLAQQPTKTEAQVVGTCKSMVKLQASIEELDQEILDLMVAAKLADDVIEKELAEASSFVLATSTREAMVDSWLRKTQAPVPVPGTSTKSKNMLEKIVCKKFSGDLSEWVTWWSQFEHIHNDSELTDVQKFHYLSQAMVPESAASFIVESYPQSSANYAIVIKELKHRYGRPELLSEHHVREFIKLAVTRIGQSEKERGSLSSLFSEVIAKYNAVKSLNITSDKYLDVLQTALIESCLGVETLKAWQRKTKDATKTTFDQLIEFLRAEVDSEQKVELASERFGATGSSHQDKKKDKKRVQTSALKSDDIPTAAGLVSHSEANQSTCVFCSGKHLVKSCGRARSIPLDERKKLVMGSKLCLTCLGVGHRAQNCKVKLYCQVCGKRHQVVMCPEISNKSSHEKRKPEASGQDRSASSEDATVMNSASVSQRILLHTCVVSVKRYQPSGREVNLRVRVLFDSGAQRSCIVEEAANKLGLVPVGSERLIHTLFGGDRTPERVHHRYLVRVESLGSGYHCNLNVLSQQKICGALPVVPDGPWIAELRARGVELQTEGDDYEIQLLIGADAYGKLLTGRVIQLECGYTAIETRLGWTLGGKLRQEVIHSSLATCVTTSLLSETSVTEMWNLESIGIKDTAETRSQKQLQEEAKSHFEKTVERNPSGRYRVHLPWTISMEALPSNKSIAVQRLKTASKKLKIQGLWEEYDRIFMEWQEAGIVSAIGEDDKSNCHYLPHRAVVKPTSLSTKVRPVFDASCKSKDSLSLNDCLEKGPNLLELIPAVLLRFRMKRIGITADIRKAFLQIEIHPPHRDFLRFLWWTDESETKLKYFRHNRVVFGVNCSPFLLNAVIEYHLKNVVQDKDLAAAVMRSLYVDNLVISVDSWEEFKKIKDFAVRTFQDACMDLCQWDSSVVEGSGSGFSTGEGCGLGTGYQKGVDLATVLGLSWDKQSDHLLVKIESLMPPEKITKRIVLSWLQKVYDPLGFLCPFVLQPKLLLQEAWVRKLGWDVELPEDLCKKFRRWLASLELVKRIKVPRRIGHLEDGNWSIHVFCDASKSSFAAAVFLRTCHRGNVEVQLLMAKSRIAPVKRVTIPRLELLSCLIGARLYKFCSDAMDLKGNATLWTDSTTALAWITRSDNWGVFVMNRVSEIRSITNVQDWKHLPGIHNPADLPSRGCVAEDLLRLKWWEGPGWLKTSEESWPTASERPDEDLVSTEKKKSVLMAASQESSDWYDWKFSSYWKVVRMVAWMLRWSSGKESRGALTQPELERAEKRIILIVQDEAKVRDYGSKGLKMRLDAEGLWRLETKLSEGTDALDFVKPIVLPSKHKFVELMIRDLHLRNCHAGVQIVMGLLRERYWVVQCRRAVQSVVSSCQRCRRYNAKPFDQEELPLPPARTETVAVFQVAGVDLAGPLYLKGGSKVWIVLFTCAVYRAIHLELVSSLSTEAFLQAFRRFVSRRNRPSVVYSDQGTNFVGMSNLLKTMDWENVREKMGLQRIDWKLNPPASPWWGGWWERLVRMVKGLLVRVLGKRTVDFEELETLLCEVESVLNSRPLTYVAEGADNVCVLTPSLFLTGRQAEGLPDVVEVGVKGLRRRLAYQEKLLEELKSRFRTEYLGKLIQRAKEIGNGSIAVGDVVLVGDNDKKRILWPLGRVTEVMPGRDGNVRVAKIRTSSGTVVRPVQKIFRLSPEFEDSDYVVEDEDSSEKIEDSEVKGYRTRSGRVVKVPARFTSG